RRQPDVHRAARRARMGRHLRRLRPGRRGNGRGPQAQGGRPPQARLAAVTTMATAVRRHLAWMAPLLLSGVLLAQTPAPAERTLDDLAKQSLSQIEGTLTLPGLRAPVEVIRDTWGVPHIYAANTDDLFFAQGYVQAQDRLWQMELWRRYNGGRLAEILGEQAVEHDRLLRLLQYQGPWDDTEFTSYHP